MGDDNIQILAAECADRELLPAFHEVSVYPKKELPFFILFTAGLCSFTALLALLTHQVRIWSLEGSAWRSRSY